MAIGELFLRWYVFLNEATLRNNVRRRLQNPEEAMNLLSYVVEVSRGWDEPNAREVGIMKS